MLASSSNFQIVHMKTNGRHSPEYHFISLVENNAHTDAKSPYRLNGDAGS